MNVFLIYLFKVNIAFSIIFTLYILLFRNNTLFKSKRIFLLSFCAFSLIYPFISVPVENPAPLFLQNINYAEGMEEPSFNVANVEATVSTPTIDLSNIILFLYVAVVVILSVRFFIQWIGLIRLIRKGVSTELMGHKVIVCPKKTSPFSFFSWIVVDKVTSQENDVREILIHEQAHVDQKHSIDAIFSEFYTIFCWLNPLTWFLRKEIRLNLEYLADASVIRSGYNAEQYQFHILRLSYPLAIAKLYTGFNFSPLKKRIKMMNTKKSSTKAYLKYILFIPVIGALLLVNQRKVDAMSTISAITTIPAISDMLIADTENPALEVSKQTPTKPKKETIFEHVEHMPVYPGGVDAFLLFVQNNVVYPVKAQEQGIHGKVRLRFVVEKDGSIGEVQILESLDPECDKAAAAVIKKSPKWTPGKQDGKPVAVWYNIPVNFEINNAPEKAGQDPASNSSKVPDGVNQKKQEKDANGRYYYVEQMPEYPGGINEFLKCMQSNVLYPIKAQEQGIQGTVRLRFVVEKDGSIGEIQIVQSLDPLCDNAAFGAVKKSLKKWIPGKMKGQPVAVWYNCPVQFTLEGGDDGKTPLSPKSSEEGVTVVGYGPK